MDVLPDLEQGPLQKYMKNVNLGYMKNVRYIWLYFCEERKVLLQLTCIQHVQLESDECTLTASNLLQTT